jgi:hypothetical protein
MFAHGNRFLFGAFGLFRGPGNHQPGDDPRTCQEKKNKDGTHEKCLGKTKQGLQQFSAGRTVLECRNTDFQKTSTTLRRNEMRNIPFSL